MEKITNTINAIDRALKIIDVIYKHGREMGVSELSKEMNEHKSTIHRTLLTLIQHGYIQQNPENNKYRIGYKLYTIGDSANYTYTLRHTVKPFAGQLVEEFHQTVSVAMHDTASQDSFRFFIVYRNEEILHPFTDSNKEHHCSSLGKSLLAFTPNFRKHLQNITLKSYTKNTITNMDEYMQHLEMIKEDGYATDDEEFSIGLTSIAVPILNRNSESIFSISVSGLTSRIRPQEQKILARLREMKQELEKIMN